MIQLSTHEGGPMIEVHPQLQDDGTTDSTVEYHITPGGTIQSFDSEGFKQALKDKFPKYRVLNLTVFDYTREEYPAIVVEFWESNFNPDYFTEEEMAEWFSDLTEAVCSVDTEEFIQRVEEGEAVSYGWDGEIRVAAKDRRYELNYHPDTPEHVELGKYGHDGYEVRTYFNVADLKALVAQIEEEN